MVLFQQSRVPLRNLWRLKEGGGWLNHRSYAYPSRVPYYLTIYSDSLKATPDSETFADRLSEHDSSRRLADLQRVLAHARRTRPLPAGPQRRVRL